MKLRNATDTAAGKLIVAVFSISMPKMPLQTGLLPPSGIKV